MTPAKSPEYVHQSDCNECRKSNRWSAHIIMAMLGMAGTLMLAGAGWAIPSVLEIQNEQAAQSKDDEWIKASLVRIEERMDALHLAGGE